MGKTSLVWRLVPFIFAAGPALADQPIVVDNAGKLIGALVSYGIVAYKVRPTLDLVEIDVRSGVLGNKPNLSFFATADCSGPIYIPKYGVIPRAYRDPANDQRIIYADVAATPVRVMSYRRVDDPNCLKSSVDPLGIDYGYPVKSVGVSQQRLVAPFSVKVE